MAKTRGPYLPNLEPFIQAGIDLKTGLPNRIKAPATKENIKIQLRNIDRQDAVNRYVWYNLPMDLPSQEVERMLYYKGQLCFFYDKDLGQFYFTPYALDGTIDVYGRYNTVHPVPMTSGTEDKGNKALAEYFANKKLKCVYGIKLPEDIKPEDFTESCVLLHDYSKQLSQTILPRAQIQDPLLDVMAECIPYMQTCLIAGSGIKAMRVNDGDQADAVHDAARGVKNAALTQEPWVAIEGSVEFQELTDGATLKAEEFMLAMQSLDNFRLSTYGIDNGGLFEKKAHELQSEADINGGPVGLVMQDGLTIRQNFCNIVNSIWGLGIWCEPAENIMGADANGDGVIYDRNEAGEHSGMESNGGNDNE